MRYQPENQHDDFPEEDISFEEETNTTLSESDELERAARKSQRQKSALQVCLDEKKEYLDGWQRARAELQNARKHFENEKREFTQFAERGLIEELLLVLDSFHMAFGNKVAWEKVDANWRTGVEYIHQQLLSVLLAHSLAPFNPLGERFNPAEHESVEVVAVTDNAQDNTVMSVLQQGYRFNGKVIRPAKVTVGHLHNDN